MKTYTLIIKDNKNLVTNSLIVHDVNLSEFIKLTKKEKTTILDMSIGETLIINNVDIIRIS